MSEFAELKQPPHSVEAEQALIGAALIGSQQILDVELAADAMYRREHRAIWKAILGLLEQRKPVDAVSVMDALMDAGVLSDAGGIEYLEQLTANTHSAANVQHYAEIIRGKAIQRNLCSLGHGLASIGYDAGDTAQKINDAQTLISEFVDGLQVGASEQPESIDDCMRRTIATLQANWNRAGGILGLSTGFADIDKRTSGFRKGDYIVLAGRPSQGKTTLAMNIAENVALAGGFVIVFCLDMPKDDLSTRMLASVARVDHTRLQNGQLTEDEIQRVTTAGAKVRGRAMFIDDRSSLTSAQLLPRARRIAHKLGRKPDLVVVDYLQLLADKGEGVERVTTISRNLKALGRELDCPALIVSQLNRGVEQRADKRPLMSDLRDSGSIEQDADLIAFVYRDEYYNENSEHKGLAELIWRKYRNGQIGTDVLSTHLDQCRFDNSLVRHIERSQPVKRKAGGFNYEN